MIDRPLVMKFGGTSVADAAAITRVIDIVARAARAGAAPPVVVVSAMSGVTDRLLALAGAAEERVEPCGGGVEALRRRHLDAVEALVPEPSRAALLHDLVRHFDDLRALLGAASLLRATAPAARDAIASIGELASSRIIAAALDAAGVPASWVDARLAIVTDANHTAAAPEPDATQAAVAQVLHPVLRAGRVAVVGGFVGATPRGVTTTLGRGGSDYSAAVVGAALGAAEIQIWTDVDGMLTADPRMVRDARVVPRLSFREASELAYFGAKVLHPSTILPAMAKAIPVRILNSRRPGAPGTVILERPQAAGRAGLAAVACKRSITTIEITSTRMLMAYGFLRRVFEVFERHRTPVDVVTTSEVSVSVTVDDGREAAQIVEELATFAEVAVERDMAIVAAVGDGLRVDPGLATRVIASLEGFPLRMVSQASSRRNVTIVLRDRDAGAAMRRLHDEFFGLTRALTESGPGADAGGICASC